MEKNNRLKESIYKHHLITNIRLYMMYSLF